MKALKTNLVPILRCIPQCKLTTDHSLRKSNVNILAKMAGFKTRQNFSLAFREETGFRPTDFLRNMP